MSQVVEQGKHNWQAVCRCGPKSQCDCPSLEQCQNRGCGKLKQLGAQDDTPCSGQAGVEPDKPAPLPVPAGPVTITFPLTVFIVQNSHNGDIITGYGQDAAANVHKNRNADLKVVPVVIHKDVTFYDQAQEDAKWQAQVDKAVALLTALPFEQSVKAFNAVKDKMFGAPK